MSTSRYRLRREGAEVRITCSLPKARLASLTALAAQNKHTPNVRKILQSQKTFANHLDDYQAMLALAESNPVAAATMSAAQTKPSTPTVASKSASPAPTTSSTGGGSKRSAAAAKRAAAKEKLEEERKKLKQAASQEPPEPEAAPSQSPAPAAATQPQPTEDGDVPMPDATAGTPQPTSNTPQPQLQPQPQTYPRESDILPPYAKPPPRAHPGDADPLLESYVPPFPTDAELRELMTAPPLSYLEARAVWADDEAARYPARAFCGVCGYWGRVKCMKCGGRVCALECLEAHREECVTRYGL